LARSLRHLFGVGTLASFNAGAGVWQPPERHGGVVAWADGESYCGAHDAVGIH